MIRIVTTPSETPLQTQIVTLKPYAVWRLISRKEVRWYPHLDDKRIAEDITHGNTPVIHGEWSLKTAFATSDISFLKDFADAQKLLYSGGSGWIVNLALFIIVFVRKTTVFSFGTSRLSIMPFNGNLLYCQYNQITDEMFRDYILAVKKGIFPVDPSKYNNPNVCKQYTK